MLLWRRLNWGVIDVDDCVAGARFLAAQGRVDAKRCVISGGSAGGYTTLAALTFRDFFQGGASYYGAGDAAPPPRRTPQVRAPQSPCLTRRYPPWADARSHGPSALSPRSVSQAPQV